MDRAAARRERRARRCNRYTHTAKAREFRIVNVIFSYIARYTSECSRFFLGNIAKRIRDEARSRSCIAEFRNYACRMYLRLSEFYRSFECFPPRRPPARRSAIKAVNRERGERRMRNSRSAARRAARETVARYKLNRRAGTLHPISQRNISLQSAHDTRRYPRVRARALQKCPTITGIRSPLH